MRTVLAALIMIALGAGTASAEAMRRQAALEPVSMLDAATLGDHRLGFALSAGFPFVQALAAYNLGDGLDANLEVDSLYGVATTLGLGPKVRLFGSSVTLGAQLLGQWTFFRTGAAQELQGARFLTGVRNFGVQPSLILSTRGHLGSLFGQVLYQGTFDTEPQSEGPLSGAPGAFTYGSNLGVHLGGELMPGGLIHAFLVVGLDFHFRSGDLPVLPVIQLGFTFSELKVSQVIHGLAGVGAQAPD